MISTVSKREFIEHLIASSRNQENALKMQNQVYALLLQDTVDGKLYKYRSFDADGFSLKNLNDNTLHCANPSEFNDPFDCKIGITFNALYKAKYENEFDLIGSIFEKFTEVLSGNIELSKCSEVEQRIICKLLENENLITFLSDNQGKKITEEEKNRILSEHLYIIIEVLQTFLSEDSLSSSFGTCASMLPKIMDSISPEGKLMISNDSATLEDFARANGIFEDTDEIGLTMLLSEKLQPGSFLAREDIKNRLDDADKQMAMKMKEFFLIGCLCTDYKNKLMWSHYADSHKGFCIEYDYSAIDIGVYTTLPLPVIYSKDRPIISWKAAFNNSPENLEESFAQFTKGLLTKDEIWSYENEWRILIKATDTADIPMPRISCVYLGASISTENKEVILKIAKENNYRVKQIVVDKGAYELHTEDVVF